jgi:hypothetical protein
MVVWAYGWHSHLLVHQSPGAVVSSQSGEQQGDPLGPLLFAVTLQGPLEEVTAMDLAQPLAYADDTFLQGAPAPTMQAFAALTALAAPLRLYAQPEKYTLCPADSAAALVAGLLGVHQAPDGLLAAGNPSMPQHSRPPKPTAVPLAPDFSWRSSWHSPVGPGTVANTPWQPPAAVDAAYIAAAATTQLAIQGGPAAFWPFDGPSSEELRLLWVTLHDTSASDRHRPVRRAQTLWAPSWRRSACSPSTLPRPVQTPCRPPFPPVLKIHWAQLLSRTCRPAFAWSDSLPLSRALQL